MCDASKRLWVRVDELLADLIDRAGSPRVDSVARKIILGLVWWDPHASGAGAAVSGSATSLSELLDAFELQIGQAGND